MKKLFFLFPFFKTVIMGLNVLGDFDTILSDTEDNDTGSEETEDEDPKDPSVEEYKTKLTNLEKSYKSQQEHLRQTNERLKDLTEFKERLTGVPEEKKNLELSKLEQEKFDNDPVGYITEMKEKIKSELESKYNDTNSRVRAKEIIDDIEKEYSVDWNKHQKKIEQKLSQFDAKAKRENPKECLISAIRLVDPEILKPKANESDLNFVERTSAYMTKRTKSEGDNIKKGMLGAKKTTFFK